MNKRQTIELINKTVCSSCGIDYDEYIDNPNSRKREYVHIRQITHHICCRLEVATLTYIGSVVDGKDHASVYHSRKTVENYLQCDRHFKELYDKCYTNVLKVVETQKKYTYTFTVLELTEFVNAFYAHKGIGVEVSKLDVEEELEK